jgi:3-polyprenyl-4-hydroxybenzoate decarboxylase
LLQIKNLNFSFNSRQILHDINILVEEGEILALVGPNGSGKSTLLRCLNGFLRPDSGQVLLGGEDISQKRRKWIARHIAFLPQNLETVQHITVYELAEIVLEGELLPNVRKPDGPFGESSGYYFHAESPVIEVKTVTFRNEPILSLIPPWGIDTETIISTFSGAELWQELSRLIPGVLDVAFLPGALTFQGVVKVAETLSMQEIRRLIHLALNLDQRLKHVIIVDEDVDIYNPREVLWALATRFQGSRDLVSLEGMKGYVIDPSTENGEGTKMGFDATARPEGPYSDRFRKVALPQEALLKAQAIIEKARHHH